MEITRLQALSNLVRAEREKQNLTQVELAQRAQLSLRWVISLEQG